VDKLSARAAGGLRQVVKLREYFLELIRIQQVIEFSAARWHQEEMQIRLEIQRVDRRWALATISLKQFTGQGGLAPVSRLAFSAGGGLVPGRRRQRQTQGCTKGVPACQRAREGRAEHVPPHPDGPVSSGDEPVGVTHGHG
jgi:hypothetical protein